MAIGTTADFSLKRNHIIDSALRKIRAVQSGDEPTLAQIDEAVRALNSIVREEDLHGTGLQSNLWAADTGYLILTAYQHIYTTSTSDGLASNILELHSANYRDANLKYKLPDISRLKNKYSGPVVVVGGGPSVDGQVDKIKELVASGAKLAVIERMYPWCTKIGLKPDFVVALDASDDVVDGFTHIQQGVKHLIVSTIKPSVIEALKGHEVYIWSGASGTSIETQRVWCENGYNHVVIINTGSTVVLATLFMSLFLGFRNVHLFGLDCMVSDPKNDYCKDIAGESVKRSYFEIEVGESDEVVTTCSAFLVFAQQFFNMIDTARQCNMIESIDVYGMSLINKMWDKPQGEKENGERSDKSALEGGYGDGSLGSSIGGVL